METCKLERCTRPKHAHNVCSTHLYHLRKYGWVEYCAEPNCDLMQVDKSTLRCRKHTPKSKCSIRECGRDQRAKGFCHKHYRTPPKVKILHSLKPAYGEYLKALNELSAQIKLAHDNAQTYKSMADELGLPDTKLLRRIRRETTS